MRRIAVTYSISSYDVMCYDFHFFYTSAPCNVTSAQDCKCIFDPKFPRVSGSSVPYSIVLFTLYFEAARCTPRFDRLPMMCLSTPLPPPRYACWRVELEVVIFRYARPDHTIQLPPSLYYECRFQLDAGLFQTDPRRDCNAHSLGPRSWDRRSHVDKFPTFTITDSLGRIDNVISKVLTLLISKSARCWWMNVPLT
jgi:hypothetical protein